MMKDLQNTKRTNIYDRFTDSVWSLLHLFYVLAGNSSTMTPGILWTRQRRNFVRTFLFCFLFIYMIVMHNQNLYLKKEYFKYHALVFALVLLGIIFLSKERKLAVKKWNSAIARWFLIFWLWTCISDFVVMKRFRSTGIIMLLIVGILFLVWQNMEHPDDILYNFMHALELLAVIGVIYNMIFRMKYDGLLYNGYMCSASDFGVFSAFLFLIFLTETYECWRIHDFGIKMGFFVWGMGISVFQIFLSGKEIAIIFAVVIVIIGLFRWVLAEYRNLSGLEKKKLFIYLILTFCFVLIYYLAVKNIPFKLHTMICYKKEKFESNKDPSVIAVLAASGIKAYQNVQFHTVGNRIWIWKEYLKAANFFGHKAPNLIALSQHQVAQNHILQIMHRYGIIAVLPYVVTFYLAGKKAMKTFWDSGKYLEKTDVLAAGVFFFWWFVGFFGNVEYPYYQPVWLMVYLLFGRYMEKAGG